MNSEFQLFDPSDENGEFELLESANEELSQIGGAPIKYLKLIGQNSQTKNRYGEITDKIYDDPIEMTVGIENTDVSSELMKFGIDEQLDYLINIDSKQVREKIQRNPKKGDKIILWNEEEIVVLNAIPQEVIGYKWHNYFLTCKRMLNENATEADEHNLDDDDSPFQFK